jgi:hypothetical protein
MAKANSEGRLCYFGAEGTAKTCNVVYWHLADMPTEVANVRSWSNSGHR